MELPESLVMSIALKNQPDEIVRNVTHAGVFPSTGRPWRMIMADRLDGYRVSILVTDGFHDI